MVKQRLSATLGWLAVTLIAGVLAGCATVPPPITQHGSGIVPTSSLEDLVTYGDVAVVFTVASENEIPPTDEEIDRGEGTITRQVVAKQDGSPVWSRPSRSEDAALPASQWVISDGGWFFERDKKVRLEVGGRTPLVVGQRYLAIRTFSSLGGNTDAEWFSLAYIPLQDNVVVYDLESSEGESYVEQLQLRSLEDVASLLDKTQPNPKVEPYMNLDAAHRYEKSL